METVLASSGQTSPRSDEAAIHRLLKMHAAACREKDIESMLELYADDVTSFDVMTPFSRFGKAQMQERLEAWFTSYEGAIDECFDELEIRVDGELAICHALVRTSGTLQDRGEVKMWSRLTLGLRSVEGEWVIFHSHGSDPVDAEGRMVTRLDG